MIISLVKWHLGRLYFSPSEHRDVVHRFCEVAQPYAVSTHFHQRDSSNGFIWPWFSHLQLPFSYRSDLPLLVRQLLCLDKSNGSSKVRGKRYGVEISDHSAGTEDVVCVGINTGKGTDHSADDRVE